MKRLKPVTDKNGVVVDFIYVDEVFQSDVFGNTSPHQFKIGSNGEVSFYKVGLGIKAIAIGQLKDKIYLKVLKKEDDYSKFPVDCIVSREKDNVHNKKKVVISQRYDLGDTLVKLGFEIGCKYYMDKHSDDIFELTFDKV